MSGVRSHFGDFYASEKTSLQFRRSRESEFHHRSAISISVIFNTDDTTPDRSPSVFLHLQFPATAEERRTLVFA
ncbi:hypothetical protein RIF29_27895 [Crotalaria pallida]|uniref:Uncharacterized protein n=1 Tax=Crotalaria pallida TaxID=3830 RepID=A0AAN9I617_CROPI